jgi:cancer susceptibility candidate protein 1
MVKVRENNEMDMEFAEDQEKDWKSIVFWNNKVGCVKARDS